VQLRVQVAVVAVAPPPAVLADQGHYMAEPAAALHQALEETPEDRV
jgi:hypothetical protein